MSEQRQLFAYLVLVPGHDISRSLMFAEDLDKARADVEKFFTEGEELTCEYRQKILDDMVITRIEGASVTVDEHGNQLASEGIELCMQALLAEISDDE